MATSNNNYRTGRLDKEEMLFIEENFKKLTVENIAAKLGRRVTSVKKFISDLPSRNASIHLDQLMGRPAWQGLKEKFTEQELSHFANEYHGFVEQFQGEVLHSEEGQILDAIQLGILADRKLKEEKSLMDSILSLNAILTKEKKSKSRDNGKIADLEHDIINCKTLIHSLSKEAAKLIEEKQKALEKMKATRKDRTDINTSAFKTSFKDWMKRLIDDADYRKEVGVYMEKSRLAADAEYERLRKPHKYMDGNEDLPILTFETLNLLEKDAKELEDKENEEL